MAKKPICPFCDEKVTQIDYKDLGLIRNYMSKHAKIVPKRYTGVCLAHQKKLANAIKNARLMGLLPFVR